MDYLDLLTILKIAGFLLTAASSLWALSQKLSADDEKGRKYLTRAGWIALTLIVTGAFTGLLSFDLENRKRIADSKIAQSRDTQRLKQLIVSGQPLSSLNLEWHFDDAPDSVHVPATAAIKEVRQLEFIPLIVFKTQN